MTAAATDAAARAMRTALERLRADDPAGAAAALAPLPAAARERADVQHALGRIAAARGEHAAAITHARRAVALAPERAELQYTLGLHALDGRQPHLALDAFDAALRLRPDLVAAQINRGLALQDLGREAEALLAFDRAIALAPGHAGAWNNRATSLLALGQAEAAAAAAAHAVQLDPDGLRWRINHFETVLAVGATATARQQLRDLLARPGVAADAAVLTRLGEAVLRREPSGGLLEELLARAALAPAAAVAWRCRLAGRAEAVGERGAARRILGHALALAPDDWATQVQHALLLDEVYASDAALQAARRNYAVGLAGLRARLAAAPPPAAAILPSLRRTSFLLAYQGGDDRPLQEAYGEWLAAGWRLADPELARHSARGARDGRIRVGYLSAHFRDCTVGHYFRSWVTLLDPTAFERTLLISGSVRDEFTQALGAECDRVVDLGGLDLAAAARRIAALQLDVLIYPELGMDPDTYPLAALRLAPLQCAGWGHPVTTGMATIDLYFSSAAAEPADGESHYRERLVRLPGLGTSYAAPPTPRRLQREELGLPVAAIAWFYPHSPFKVHPAGDAALLAVLAQTPDSVLVLFDGPTRDGTAALRRRLLAGAAAAGVAESRLRWLPATSRTRFLEVAAACDAMLDPWHWSGGNTSLDALCAGLPIVTLPGEFMRGRQSAAMLRLLGLPELIAATPEDFVAIAVRLAGDPARRQALRARIAARRGVLFDDPAPVAALAATLQREVARCRAEAA